MVKEEIFGVVKNCALAIWPGVVAERVELDCQPKALGAGSSARVAIVTGPLAAFDLHVPPAAISPASSNSFGLGGVNRSIASRRHRADDV